jgi:tetratricopeptide (TPR) repeat protein
LSGKGRNPVYRSIAEVYLNFGRAEIAKKVIDEYLPDTALNDREKYWKYFNLGVIACQLYDFPGALSNYERAAAYAPNEGYLYAKRGEMLGKLGRINEGRRSFEKALELSRGNRLILRMAATFYLETGDTRLSDEYFRQLEDPRTYLCKQLTKQNYSAVVKLADERGISMVCMEYPTRNITSLKEMLDYNPKLLFVDNEALFKNAVRKYGYDVIFRDKFGISFGHCTDKGNRLLAENLSDRILERFFYSTDPARIRI